MIVSLPSQEEIQASQKRLKQTKKQAINQEKKPVPELMTASNVENEAAIGHLFCVVHMYSNYISPNW